LRILSGREDEDRVALCADEFSFGRCSWDDLIDGENRDIDSLDRLKDRAVKYSLSDPVREAARGEVAPATILSFVRPVLRDDAQDDALEDDARMYSCVSASHS